MVFKALRKVISKSAYQNDRSQLREKLMHQIALIGGQLFGESDKERLFYIRDRKTVVWKEGSITTYYQMTDNGVLKSQTGYPQERISDSEARRLLRAVRSYQSMALRYLSGITKPA